MIAQMLRAHVQVRTLPAVSELAQGMVSTSDLRELDIDDLLGREPVQLDWTAIRQALSGKRVLVTGGGGSIGAELCRQVARLGASALGILEQSEYNLYQIERQLRRAVLKRHTIEIQLTAQHAAPADSAVDPHPDGDGDEQSRLYFRHDAGAELRRIPAQGRI